MAASKAQRVAIWVVTIAMAVGTLGAYFLIILQNDEQQQQTNQTQEEAQPELEVDPTAHKVENKVNELQKTDIKVGEGTEVKTGDRIKVHYKGTIATTGQKFDSSYDRGEPVTLSLSEVIRGWQDGVPGMKEGGKRRLVIPAELGYGSQAAGGIPANSDLVFEIEVLEVNPPEQQ